MGPASGRAPFLGVVCAGVVSSLLACGGGSPASPTQPSSSAPDASPPAAGTLRGTVTDLASGKPVEGATLAFSFGPGSPAATAGTGGAWEITYPGSSVTSVPVEISAPGYVTRRTFVRWATGTRGDIGIDLIGESTPFSIAYYRQIVRNQYDKPDEAPQPLRRWVRTPNFYIHTANPKTGGHVLQSEIDMVTEAIRAAVPQVTGGQFEAGAIEAGPEERGARSGFIRLKFIHQPESKFCGQAYVGADPGEIEINYGVSGCQTACGPFAPRTVAHEVGHAMGFYHVAQGRVLSTVWYNRDCGVTTFSEEERHNARVAYARAPGNRDPDDDPAWSTLLTDQSPPPVRVTCR
jgi:hypothetical protein